MRACTCWRSGCRSNAMPYFLSPPSVIDCRRRTSCKNHAFEHRANDALFFLIETRDGLKLQAKVVIGAAFILAELQPIGTDLEGCDEFPDNFESWLRGTCFVSF